MARIAGAFHQITVAAMAHAFDEACSRLPLSADPEERELLAKRIVGTAALGERDVDKMRDDAVAYTSA